jgi:hypothetical protein
VPHSDATLGCGLRRLGSLEEVLHFRRAPQAADLFFIADVFERLRSQSSRPGPSSSTAATLGAPGSKIFVVNPAFIAICPMSDSILYLAGWSVVARFETESKTC